MSDGKSSLYLSALTSIDSPIRAVDIWQRDLEEIPRVIEPILSGECNVVDELTRHLEKTV